MRLQARDERAAGGNAAVCIDTSKSDYATATTAASL
jgi:hypothetical protein